MDFTDYRCGYHGRVNRFGAGRVVRLAVSFMKGEKMKIQFDRKNCFSCGSRFRKIGAFDSKGLPYCKKCAAKMPKDERAKGIEFVEENAAGRVTSADPLQSYGLGIAPYGTIDGLIVKNNIVRNAPSFGMNLHGIYSGMTADSSIVKSSIKNNTIVDTYATKRTSGFYLSSTGTVTDTTVKNNRIYITSGTAPSYTLSENFLNIASYATSSTLSRLDMLDGKRKNNAGASATIALTLPPAIIGLKGQFVRVGGNILRLDPSASEIIGGGGAGKYLSIDSDNSIIGLECLAAGVWSITEQTGVITFEP